MRFTKDMTMKIGRRALALAFVFLAFVPRVEAVVELTDPGQSVRANGMGGAYTAVVMDSDSFFYNPAGLSRHSGFSWTVFDPGVGVGGVDSIQSAQSVLTGGSANMASNLGALYGKKIFASGNAKSAVILPGVAFTGFANGQAQFNLHNPAATTMNLNYFFDYGFALGTGFSLIPGVWHHGIVGRRVNRTGTSLPLGSATLAQLDFAALETEFKRRGTGYGLDYGSVLTIPGPVAPAFSFVYRDIGYTSFTHEEGAGAPPRTEPEMVIGASLKIDALIASITPAIDYRFAQRTDVQMGKKLHLGVEVSLPLIDIRAGLNQGYYTLGVGMNLGVLRADVATYGVELGEYPGQLEDRRYMAQVTFELGFDPGMFGFGGGSGSGSDGGGGSGGGRSRLKQRR
ncbi:MAG: hypothetical protein AAB250_03910 [Bdellovibrionota bacterium]